MNSFLRKVEAEREVLSIVNIYTKGKEQLSGLSSAAISNWCKFNKISDESSVSKSLLRLGDLCNSLSDRSNESFMAIPKERLHRIKAEEASLNRALEAVFRERLTHMSL